MSYKILLLDDDERFRKMVLPGLLKKELEVIEASNGAEALNLMKEQQFDLLIVDGVLPDTDGIKWLTRYRASGGTSSLIFISAHWQSAEVYQILTKDLGVSQVIHKPVIPSVFAEQVYSEITRPQWTPTAETEVKVEDSVLLSIEELSKEYVEELPGELDKISALLSDAERSANPAEELHKVRLLSHKLRGTAGTFGLQNLGDLMGKIEDSIRNMEVLNSSSVELVKEYQKQSIKIVEEKGKETKSKSEKSVSFEQTANLRILVVDEDQAFLDDVKEVAAQRLVEVVTASSPVQVFEVLSNSTVDAILIDVKLAGYKSFELVRTIRELTEEKIPIAFVSDDTNLDDRLLAAHLGASLYLNKPIDPDTLEDAIQRLMLLKSAEHPKVLIVDDDQFFAKRVSRVLFDKGIDTQILTEPSRILEKLQEFSPDLLILDLMMPFISGFDICKMLRTIPRWQDMPIVFVTAQTGLATRIAAFACRADDYLAKPLSDDELVARVSLRIERSRSLKDRAERDPVTGLLIRRGFMERFNAALGLAKRISKPVSLVLFDLDKFKSINDNHGHLAGDAVLAGLGRLMNKRFRVEDLRGRWGGDEFVLAFIGSDREHSIKLMDGFLEEYCSMTFTGENGEHFSASLSAGIATYPDDCDNSYELLRVADQRLYLAKSQGRKRIVAETPVKTSKGN